MAGLIAAGEQPSAGKLSIQRWEAAASADLPLTSSVTAVSGTLINAAAQTAGAFFTASVSLRMDRTATASTSFAIMRLFVDGAAYGGQIVVRDGTAAVATQTPEKTFSGSLTAGNHTFEIRGSCATSSIWTAVAGDTNLVVVIYG
jgi:hypothetical protein